MRFFFLFAAVFFAWSSVAQAQGADQYFEVGPQGCSFGQALVGLHVDREIHLCIDVTGTPVFAEAETNLQRQGMLACGAGSYALRYQDTTNGYIENELVCALGPIARTDFEIVDGLNGAGYQYVLSDGGTAHGCPYLVSPDGSTLIVQVITGVHRGRNDFLCAPLQPFAPGELMRVSR